MADEEFELNVDRVSDSLLDIAEGEMFGVFMQAIEDCIYIVVKNMEDDETTSYTVKMLREFADVLEKPNEVVH